MRRQNQQLPPTQMQRNMNYQQHAQQHQGYEEEDDDENQYDMDQYGEYGEDEEGEMVFQNEEEYLAYMEMREQELAQQGIHLVQFEPDYEPNEEEILEYAEFLGMNLDEDQEFFYIARECLVAPLPEGWSYAQVDGQDATYFFDRLTLQLYEENPNDEYFRNKYQDEIRLREIKKQRLNPPPATSKKRSKLQNLIDQCSNDVEISSQQSQQPTKQNIKSEVSTKLNISNIDPSAPTSNKQSVIQNNEVSSLSNIGQITSKQNQSKQGSVQETNLGKNKKLESLTNAKTLNSKNKSQLEPLGEKFSKEITDSKPSSKAVFGKKESDYDFNEDAFMQSDEDDKSSNIPKGKESILDNKSQNSRQVSAQNKKDNKSPITSQNKSQKAEKKSVSNKNKKGMDELEEVDLEDIQDQDSHSGVSSLKLNPIVEKKPSSMKPLEKKSSKESLTKENTQKNNSKKDQLEEKDKKQHLQDKKQDSSDTLNQQKKPEKLNDLKQNDKIKNKINELHENQNEKHEPLDIDIGKKEDISKNFASSGQKYSSVESKSKIDNSKSKDYNLTKDLEDTDYYTYSKDESVSKDFISNSGQKNEQAENQIQKNIPSNQQQISPNKENKDKQLIRIDENVNDSEISLDKNRQVSRKYNAEEQQEEDSEIEEPQEIDIESLEFEDQLNIQAYLEESEKDLQKITDFYEIEVRQYQLEYNRMLQNEKNQNCDDFDNTRKKLDYFQTQEKKRIRDKVLKETQNQEDAEIKKMQNKFDENIKIYKEEENFNIEQKGNEFENLLKDKFYQKLEQHEKIIKNLKNIITKNGYIYNEYRKSLKQKFDKQYKNLIFQQCSSKYQSEIVDLEKQFGIQQKNVIYYLDAEYERTKQLEADEIQKQKLLKTTKLLDVKELFIKKYYFEKQDQELEIEKKLQNMYKSETESLDQIFLDKYQQELNQTLFKRQMLHEQDLGFVNDMNEQKLNEYSKLSLKEQDHQIKLLEIEHSRRLNQIEEQLKEKKGLQNNYKYISERQNQTQNDTKLKIIELQNLIDLKKQQYHILQKEKSQIEQDHQDISLNMNILKNQKNLEQFLKQQLENRVKQIQHLKGRQDQRKQDMKLLQQNQEQKQDNDQQYIPELSEAQNILIKYPHSSELLYKNKQRSKLWSESIKHENQVIEQQKHKLKYQKVYLKTIYQDIQSEKESQKGKIEQIKKQTDIIEDEKEFIIQKLLDSKQHLVDQFNEDVKLVRRNQELMRKRDEQLLQVEKCFNKTMNLGLDEENLIEEFNKFKKLMNQPFKQLKLVPNNDIEVQAKINNYQDMSSFLDITGTEEQPQYKYTPPLQQKFEFVDTEVNKMPHHLKDVYEGLSTPFIKGMVNQRQEKNQYDVNRIEDLLKNAKLSQQVMQTKLSRILQQREQTKTNENINRIKSEVSKHHQWFKDAKQYINQTLFDRTSARTHLNTII